MSDELANPTEPVATEKTCPVEEWQTAFEETIREKPVGSVIVAALAGLIIQRIPIRGLFILLIKAALHLLKPALVLFMVYKVIEAVVEDDGDQDDRPAPGAGQP